MKRNICWCIFLTDGILFSQDAFGMHFATHQLFADQNSYDIMRDETSKYYANILLPYSNLVAKLIEKVPSLSLNIQCIAPDHGPIWRTKKDIAWITQLWQNWAAQKKKPKMVITYDTMWHSTSLMAHTIADGAMQEDIVVKVMPLASTHRSDIATELLETKALLVGSPTINQQLFPTVADILCYLQGLKPKNLIGQAFGSYGWANESIKHIQTALQAMQVTLIDEPIAAKYVPNQATLTACKNLGKNMARHIKDALKDE